MDTPFWVTPTNVEMLAVIKMCGIVDINVNFNARAILWEYLGEVNPIMSGTQKMLLISAEIKDGLVNVIVKTYIPMGIMVTMAQYTNANLDALETFKAMGWLSPTVTKLLISIVLDFLNGNPNPDTPLAPNTLTSKSVAKTEVLLSSKLKRLPT